MTDKLTLKDCDLKGKRVLMRVDFNVPLDKDKAITDASRIVAALPSIEYVLNHSASLILMSHLGKPGGKKDPQYTLKPCAEKLAALLNKKVLMAPDCIGPQVEKMASELKEGQIMLLENLRFYEAEEKPEKDPSFAKNLSKLGDIYINDAFGTAHRKHSSTATIAQYFPGKAAMGFLMEKEVNFLGSAITNPKRPFFAIIGGAKISSKIGVVLKLFEKVDALFIGGGMAYTFLKAQGVEIGASAFEEKELANVTELLKKSAQKKVKIFLPSDIIIANDFSNDADKKIISINDGIPQGWQGMGIGPKTVQLWSKELKNAATIFWNGPLDVFEFTNFAFGTKEIAKIIAKVPAITIVGGGDSVAAINGLGLQNKFSHLSTGGGASLEYIENGQLPGIEALSNKI